MNYHDLTSWRHWNDGNWIWGIIPLNGRMTTVLSGQWIIQPESWKKCVFATWTWKDSWHPTRNKHWGIHRLNYGSLLLSMWLVHPDISRYFLSFRNPLNDILTFLGWWLKNLLQQLYFWPCRPISPCWFWRCLHLHLLLDAHQRLGLG